MFAVYIWLFQHQIFDSENSKKVRQPIEKCPEKNGVNLKQKDNESSQKLKKKNKKQKTKTIPNVEFGIIIIIISLDLSSSS